MRVQQAGLHFLLNGDLCLCCQCVRHQVLIPIIFLLSIILLELKICNVKMFSSFMCFSLNDYNVHIFIIQKHSGPSLTAYYFYLPMFSLLFPIPSGLEAAS